MVLNIFSIIVGLLHSLLLFVFPKGITIDTDGATVELLKIVILFGTYTMFYNLLSQYVNYKININNNSISNITIISNILYYVTSIISSIFIAKVLSIELGMLIMLVISVIITNAAILVFRYKKITEDYALEIFWNDLAFENRKNNTNRNKVIAQEIRLCLVGLILGIISTLPLIVFYKNSEESLFITIIAVAIVIALFPTAVDIIKENLIKKNKKNTTQNKYFLENIIGNSYILYSAISYFFVLTLHFKMNYCYAIVIAFITYLITSYRIRTSWDNSGVISFGATPSYNYGNNDSTSDTAFTTTTFFDNKGNYSGNTTTFNVGGVEFTHVKDEKGNIVGTGSSVDLGGAKLNTYKKQ